MLRAPETREAAMSVFVLTRAYDYEGESPVGVFASAALAKVQAEKQADEFGYSRGNWSTVENRIELDCGSTQWVIREEQVQGYEPEMCESLEKYGRCGA